MIYQIFDAKTLHHVPRIIEGILKYASDTNKLGVEEHFFLLRYENNTRLSLRDIQNEIDIYLKIFKENQTGNYRFLYNSYSFTRYICNIKPQDRIIIHNIQSLFGRNPLFWLLLLVLGRNFRSRVTIFFWGVAERRKRNGDYFFFISNKIKRFVLKSVRYVITLTSDDAKKIKEWFTLSNVIVTGYIRDTYKEFRVYAKSLEESQSPKKIMISHSSFNHNYHLEIFDLLARFNDENIKIICPLSYGNAHYREKVVKRGKEIFGDKFVYYDKLLPRSEYNDLLASIDIYISNAIMQTGLYVVAFCICTGRKLFLRENNFNWVTQLGFKVNHVSELRELSYKDLITPIGNDWQISNDLLAAEVYSAKPKIEDWKLFYR